MKKLYLLTTKGVGSFYIVASDPTEAENALNEKLSKENHGRSVNRAVKDIRFLASEGSLSNDLPLIIV